MGKRMRRRCQTSKQLQGRVAELEQQVDRLHELEERLDFTERLLAQQREQPRIGS